MAGYLNTVMEGFFYKDYFLSGDLGYFKTYKSKKYFFISLAFDNIIGSLL